MSRKEDIIWAGIVLVLLYVAAAIMFAAQSEPRPEPTYQPQEIPHSDLKSCRACWNE